MFVYNSWFGDFVVLVITILVIIISYFKWTYQYWEKRKLPYLPPQIPFGNIAKTVRSKETFGLTVKHLYEEIKSNNWKHAGVYFMLSPMYMPVDLDYVRNILTKDFQYFMDRNTYFNEKDDPLSAHLVNLRGTRWRNLRAKLTPTFTSGKMKMMFQTLVECESKLQHQMEKEIEKNTPIDIKEILACFTTDIIGSVAFGLDCQSFDQENSPFRVFGRKLFTSSKWNRLKRTLSSNFPRIAVKLGVRSSSKEVSEFYRKVVEDTVTYRETNNLRRNDFMQLLIDLKNNKLTEENGTQVDGTGLTMNEVAAQSFVFFAAGFETSSTLMTFTLYELAKNQDIQDKLRSEIKAVLSKHEDKITYDSIQDMKYLSQVIDESLRKYPPAPLTNRKCLKDYKIPDTDFVIEKGTTVVIPIMGIHYDEDYYPNPEKFDPDRFSDENKASRHHFTHLPFGEGPRICIGLRFGLMQAKVGLASLISNFKFTVNPKTQEPLKMKPTSVILSVEGEVWLNAQKL